MLSSFGEALGLNHGLALRVAGAFGGGMACMGEACGAVTGAFMAIGLKYGKAKVGDDETREQTYELVREFVTQFKARHESIVCRDLLGCDLSKPEEREAAHHKGLFDALCPQFVGDAAEILEQIL